MTRMVVDGGGLPVGKLAKKEIGRGRTCQREKGVE